MNPLFEDYVQQDMELSNEYSRLMIRYGSERVIAAVTIIRYLATGSSCSDSNLRLEATRALLTLTAQTLIEKEDINDNQVLDNEFPFEAAKKIGATIIDVITEVIRGQKDARKA